jgi:hypothetical protein
MVIVKMFGCKSTVIDMFYIENISDSFLHHNKIQICLLNVHLLNGKLNTFPIGLFLLKI